MNPNSPGVRAALVIAHPAHELRLLGWLARVKPVTFVLTDGAGRVGRPRLARTAALLRQVGAEQGAVFGDLTDRSVYLDLLAGRHDALLTIIDRLADGFVDARIDVVVVDAHEDAFLTHDVLNALARAAALAAGERLGRPLPLYDYPLENDPSYCPADRRDGTVLMRLDAEQLKWKLDVARGYREVANEVQEALHLFGQGSFAVECLRPIRDAAAVYRPTEKPEYELHGEQGVADGVYTRVVRYRQHVAPFLQRAASYAPALGTATLARAA
ncbi:hypothetical protein Pla175_03440 [Pirellulimonas nuda]|uniref:GlcNAc-PI de-N-acetylase n=1 Tax=Pirellulimonas nuda TaxID=2528009 RepID=A0A518D686_9BACT|nr:hypothetical protein [Pirellulimonas nuda]QDU86990.1 hypothetical protein Pla175_03440 [Pirellulimonas nuda]